jgi:hypothetical protein
MRSAYPSRPPSLQRADAIRLERLSETRGQKAADVVAELLRDVERSLA